MKTEQNLINDLAKVHLGQVGGKGYSETYDPTLLVAIPRQLNRVEYSLTGQEFVGTDVWNAYEVSVLTKKGLPVNGMMKLIFPADGNNHVESKSLKLYLNSFNMTMIGDTQSEAIKLLEEVVERDLTLALGCTVAAKFFTTEENHLSFNPFETFVPLSKIVDLDSIVFTDYKSNASQLGTNKLTSVDNVNMKVCSDLLRSNCRVTHQPDWGKLYIEIEGKNVPHPESLAKYIVSHRKVSHFHEEIVEMTFAHLTQAFNPEKLMVTALYTRRGGIDLNPIRATHVDMIPAVFLNTEVLLQKTLRQ